MRTTKIVNSPVFHFIRDFFVGDGIVHYLPAKYLWYVCNVAKTGFYQPVYDFKLDGPITLDFMFYPEQPQHKYFQKPAWINEFIVAKDAIAAQQIVRRYDYFINNLRYRGAQPPDLNWGCTGDIKSVELYTQVYTDKAICEHGIYLDDLVLNAEYQEYLQSVIRMINPERRPIIALHQRGNDHSKRHLPNSAELNEVLLCNLLDAYPEHQIVLLGESWRYHRHPRIKYLEDHINLRNLKKQFKDYSASLQFILAAYFCRDADLIFCGISGFTQFIESIRPLDKTPPIPIFWGPDAFAGRDTKPFLARKWVCPELHAYRQAHPEDISFNDNPQCFYYSRNEALLKPYCLDYPNNLDKIFTLLKKAYAANDHKIVIRALPQSFMEKIVTYLWYLKPYTRLLRRLYQIVFIQRASLFQLKAIISDWLLMGWAGSKPDS